MLRLVRRARNVTSALLLVAALVPGAPSPAPGPAVTALLRPASGWPGTPVLVSFPAEKYGVASCSLTWEDEPAEPCKWLEPTELTRAMVRARTEVPAGARPGVTRLRWEIEYNADPAASPPVNPTAASGDAEFFVWGRSPRLRRRSIPVTR